ncbi:class I SAM-dependent methyltransferase [bacterium]|nr:class I SAM-dependent methyltransferase [bacterium]
MTDKNVKFEGNIPEFYDRHLGPVIFEPYAGDLAQRVAAVVPDGPVLETACGTGILTRQLRAKLLNTAQIISTDLNQAMIDQAFAKPGLASEVEWKQADASALPFSDRVFAAVVCQFGMMFLPDKSLAIREAERVLKDGGLFAFNVWDSHAENPFGRIADEAVTVFFDYDPPNFYKIPFGFSDAEMWINLLKENGFGKIEVNKVSMEARSDSAESFATGLVRGNPVNTAIQERGLQFDPIISAVTEALVRIGGDRPFTCPMQALVFTARANTP